MAVAKKAATKSETKKSSSYDKMTGPIYGRSVDPNKIEWADSSLPKKSKSEENKVSSRFTGSISSTREISSLDDIEWANPAIKEAFMKSRKG